MVITKQSTDMCRPRSETNLDTSSYFDTFNSKVKIYITVSTINDSTQKIYILIWNQNYTKL